MYIFLNDRYDEVMYIVTILVTSLDFVKIWSLISSFLQFQYD